METDSGKIDLNLADVDDLSLLQGIGENLAERIIDFRDKEGFFSDVSDLVAVPGISEEMIQKFADQVEVRDLPVPGEQRQNLVESDQSEEEQLESDDETAEEVSGEIIVESMNEEETVEESDDSETSLLSEETAVDEVEPNLAESGERMENGIEQTEEEVEGIVDSVMLLDQDDDAVDLPEVPPQAKNIGIRAGCLGGFVGALFAVLLTLGLLFVFNRGTLRFASVSSTGNLERALVRQAATSEAVQSQLFEKVEELQGGADRLSGELEELSQEQQRMVSGLDEVLMLIPELEETIIAVDKQMNSVSEAAENFTSFLGGMYELLDDFVEQPIRIPTRPGSGASATPIPNSPTPTGTNIAATRTPRPTSTPLGTN